ncbi:ORF6N domain-containing protein [Escherichia coli]|nr:ORF6N domain-containing protein [Escherichia coli]
MAVQISVENLSPVTYNQIPVITTELLAHLYGTKIKNISDNFLNNTTRFMPGKHYFKIEKNELREFKNRPETIGLVGKNARSLILWTERGAARHAKMLETDQAWDVFEKLEDCYFSQCEKNTGKQEKKLNGLSAKDKFSYIIGRARGVLINHTRDIDIYEPDGPTNLLAWERLKNKELPPSLHRY